MTSLTHADLAEQIKLAAEAFLYGYPLVYNLREIAKFPAGPNLVGPQASPTTRSDTPGACSIRRPISCPPTTTRCT